MLVEGQGKKRLRRMAVFLFTPLERWDDGYRTRGTFQHMLPGFVDRGVKIDLIAPVVDQGTDAQGVQTVDPRVRVIPLAGFTGGRQMYLTRAPQILRSLRNALKRHGSEWDLVWIIDVDLYSQVFRAMCVRAGLDVMLYLRARYDPRLYWQRTNGLRTIPAQILRLWLRHSIPRLAERTPTVFSGADLRRVLAPHAQTIHIWVPTLVHRSELHRMAQPVHSGTDTTLLVVGRVVPAKGLGVLIEAIGRLAPKSRPRVRIVGTTLEWHVAELMERAAQLGVREQLTFTGPIPYGPMMRKEYEGSDLVVLPSLTETTSKVVVEALAAGVPIIASAVGAIPEVLGEDGCGILVPPGDPVALANAIAAVLADPVQAAELRRKALIRARLFTLEAQQKGLLSFVDECFGRASCSGAT